MSIDKKIVEGFYNFGEYGDITTKDLLLDENVRDRIKKILISDNIDSGVTHYLKLSSVLQEYVRFILNEIKIANDSLEEETDAANNIKENDTRVLRLLKEVPKEDEPAFCYLLGLNDHWNEGFFTFRYDILPSKEISNASKVIIDKKMREYVIENENLVWDYKNAILSITSKTCPSLLIDQIRFIVEFKYFQDHYKHSFFYNFIKISKVLYAKKYKDDLIWIMDLCFMDDIGRYIQTAEYMLEILGDERDDIRIRIESAISKYKKNLQQKREKEKKEQEQQKKENKRGLKRLNKILLKMKKRE